MQHASGVTPSAVSICRFCTDVYSVIKNHDGAAGFAGAGKRIVLEAAAAKAASPAAVFGIAPNGVVTAPHTEVAKLGDIRELKTPAPPFIEVRVKPPKHDLRFFGRFVGKDAMILSTFGTKSPDRKTGVKPLSVSAERGRCDAVFKALKIDLKSVPTTIRDSLSNAGFV